MRVTVDPDKVMLALYAAQYAAQPERVAAFHQWLCRNADDPGDIVPAYQIPTALAEGVIMIIEALNTVLGPPRTGHRPPGRR